MSEFGHDTPRRTRYYENIVLTGLLFFVAGPLVVGALVFLRLSFQLGSPEALLAVVATVNLWLPLYLVFVTMLAIGPNLLATGVAVAAASKVIQNETALSLFAVLVGIIASLVMFPLLGNPSLKIMRAPWGAVESILIGGGSALILTRMTRFLRRWWRRGSPEGVSS